MLLTVNYNHSTADLLLPSKELEENALLSQIGHLYYNENMKVTDIAKHFSFSPAKVSRLLAQAREKKIVEIHVKRIHGRISELEDALKAKYHLTDAIIVNSFQEENLIDELDILTDFAAAYTSRLLSGKKVLGISNGTAVNMVAEKIRPYHQCELDIIQLLGSGGGAFKDIESRNLANRLLQLFPGGKTFFLNAPIYIESDAAKDGLLKDTAISTTINRMKSCDIILTGVGSFDVTRENLPDVICEYQTDQHLLELSSYHAAGCVCAQFYDTEGRLIDCSWNKNCISMSFEEIRKNKMTIGVACGNKKIVPLRGALKAGLFNVLVTTSQVASELCKD